MAGGFQTQVNVQPSPGVEGDFADHNPRSSVDFGPFGAVAGPLGITVGRFAWASYSSVDADGAPAAINNYGSGLVAGFIHREQQGMVTTYLANASMGLPAGFGVTVMSSGGYWARNAGASQAIPGMICYAKLSTGEAFFGTVVPAGGTSTASSIAAVTIGFTGSISGNILTVTVGGSGNLYPGTVIAGTGVAAGTSIVSQLSGTPLGVGSYALSIPEQSVVSEVMTGSYGVLTVGGTITGTFVIGALLSGTASPVAGTYITALGTGVGGAGTYIVNLTQTVSSGQILANLYVATKWFAASSGLAGELVKISSQALG